MKPNNNRDYEKDLREKLRGLDGLIPPAEEKMLDRLGQIRDNPAALASAAPAGRPKPRRWMWIAAAAVLLAGLLTVTVFAAVRDTMEYKEALAYCLEHNLPTEGLSRAEIKETWRKFTVSRSGKDTQNRGIVQGHELLLCTPEEAALALAATDKPGAEWTTEHNRELSSSGAAPSYGYYSSLSDESGNYYGDETLYPKYTAFIGKGETSDGPWLWKTEVSPLVYISVIPCSDRVFVTGIDKHGTTDSPNNQCVVTCLSAETGTVLWRTVFSPGESANGLPMGAVPDADGITVFCRIDKGKYARLVTVRFDNNGSLTAEEISESINSFNIAEAIALPAGYCLHLTELPGAPAEEELVYIDRNYQVKRRYLLEMEEVISTESQYTPKFSRIVAQGNLVWIAGSTDDIYDTITSGLFDDAFSQYAVDKVLEDGSEYQFFNYNRLCWKKDAVIEEIRRKNLSYVFAWDPLTGDILYQCSAPGCFVPRSRIYDYYPGDVLRINENGEIVWTVYSIVGIEPVGLFVSSMREWVTSAVYEVTITGDGAILPRFIGGIITSE